MQMVSKQRRFSANEFARRGDDIFDRRVRPNLRAEDRGKIVAIDIESEEWELDANEIDACDRLAARCTDAQIWFVRVGSRVVRRFGAGHSGVLPDQYVA